MRVTRREHGFMLVELMVAILVMTIGIIALVSTFDFSRKTASTAEMLDTATAVGNKAIERVSALPWSQIALSQAPTANSGAGADDPTYYLSAGPCATGASLPTHSPCYQWDWANTANVEPLVIDSSNGDTTANPLSWSAPISTSNANVRVSGKVYRYITWVNDPSCTASTCGGQNAYKRLTVAVTVQGMAKPVWVSTLLTNPAGKTRNPLNGGGASCLSGGSSVPCTH